MAENEAQGEWTLPDGWVWTTLGEIMEPSEEKANPKEIQRTPYIGLEHIEKDTGKLLSFGYSDEVRSTKTVFHRGNLLYGKLRPYLNKVHIADFGGVCSTDILVFPKNLYASNRYLLYRLLSGDFVRYANLNVSGVQHPRTNFKILSKFPLSLPPLAEQLRIVAEIETQFTRLDAAVAALKRAQANIRRYKAAVLKAACEGRLVPTEAELARAESRTYEPADQLLARILAKRRARWEAEHPGKRYKEPEPPDMEDLLESPEGWVWATVEQLAKSIQYGHTESAKEDPVGPKFLRITDIQDGQVNWNTVLYCKCSEEEYRKYLLEPGDIVFARTGATTGKSYLITDRPDAVFASYLIRLRISKSLDVKYFALFLDTPIYWAQIMNVRKGSAQPGVNATILATLRVPLPPLAEQLRIVAEVERRLSVVAALENTVSAALARAGRLRQAVLKQAFEGRLVAQDPDDEPASVLLERIQAERPQRERKSNRREQPKQKELF